jgi:thiamine biosynthesis lipoprotein
MHRFQHTAMAAQFEIRCTHPDAGYAQQAARCAFEAVDRLEQQLSRFVENSDVSRINHLSGGESTAVSVETMQCLRLAAMVHGATGGAFDVSIGTGFDSLELPPGEFLVRARASGVRLDMGAIGKGFAVDRVAEVLEDWEVTQALVDAGFSSVLALEPPAGRDEWPLTLSIPGDEVGPVFARIAARQRALGASGIRKGDHIRYPADRTPVRSRTAAWVSAPRSVLSEVSREAGIDPSPAALADALSTAFMIMPVEEIEAYCLSHRGIEAWILEGEVRYYGSPNTLESHP